MSKQIIELTLRQVSEIYAALPLPWEHIKSFGIARSFRVCLLDQDHYNRTMKELEKAEESNINVNNYQQVLHHTIEFMVDTNSREMHWKPVSHILQIK